MAIHCILWIQWNGRICSQPSVHLLGGGEVLLFSSKFCPFHTELLYLVNAVFHQIRLWTYAYMEQQAKMRVEWMIRVCGDGEAQEAGHWRGSFPSRSRMQDTIHLATTSSSQ